MNKELKEQAHKEFDEKFKSICKKHIIEKYLCDPESFYIKNAQTFVDSLYFLIDSLIDKTVLQKQERVVEELKLSRMFFYATQEDKDEVVSLITNKSDINN